HQYQRSRIDELLDSTIDAHQLAKIIGCSRGSIMNTRSQIKHGKRPIDALPAGVVSHGALRFRVSVVEKWLEEKEQKQLQRIQAHAQAKQAKRPRGRPRKNPVDAVGRNIA